MSAPETYSLLISPRMRTVWSKGTCATIEISRGEHPIAPSTHSSGYCRDRRTLPAARSEYCEGTFLW
jgi:hypothetical protein